MDQITKTQPPVTVSSVAVKWGLIWGIVAVIISAAFSLMFTPDGSPNKLAGLLVMLIFIGLVIYMQYKAIAEYKNAQDMQYISFGKAFKIAFIASLISCVIAILYMYINYTFITDIDIENQQMLDSQIKAMKERGQNEESIKATIEITKKFMTLSAKLISSFIMFIIIDVIIALIMAAILKKTPIND